MNFERNGSDIWKKAGNIDINTHITPDLYNLELTSYKPCINKNDFKILIDLDDTLINTCELWIQWLNNISRYKRTYDEITDWDISSFYPDLTEKEVYSPLINERFWELVTPKPGAEECLRRLNHEGFDLYICTSTHPSKVSNKYEKVIKRYYPFINWRHIIISNSKEMVNGDVLIDDGYHNHSRKRLGNILIDAPHNSKYDLKSENMIRVSSWDNIYDIVNELYNKAKEMSGINVLCAVGQNTGELINAEQLKKYYAWWRNTEEGSKMANIFDEIVDAQPRII